MHRYFLLLATLIASQSYSQVTQGGHPLPLTQARAAEVPTYEMPQVDLEALQAGDAVTDLVKTAPWRFGAEFEVSIDCQREDDGVWSEEQGVAVWRAAVKSEGAIAMGLWFSGFELPKGAKLFVRSAGESSGAHRFLGAFTHANNKAWNALATGLIAGDEVIVELQVPLDKREACRLEVGQVVHAYRDILNKAQERGPFGNSGACNINVNCPEGELWQCEKRSVALIVEGGFAMCTGALINTTAQDGTPVFLTANHCLGGSMNNWLFYFNHETSGCTGNSGPTDQSVSGATLLVSNGGSDFGLIELSETPPADYNVFYAGWNTTDSEAQVVNAVSIHHPSGDLKKICFEDDAPYHDNAGGASVWMIDQWELGVTEPGSSGAPLFDQDHRIIGQLYGGAAACNGTVNNGQLDYYGRLGVAWGLGASDVLDPNGTGTQVLDGFPAEGCVTSLELDAGVGIVGLPDEVLCGSEQITASYILSNFGTVTLTQVNLEYVINGGAPVQTQWNGSLEQYDNVQVDLPGFAAQDGENTVSIAVLSVNGEGDESAFNNSASGEFMAFVGPTLGWELVLTLDDYGSETTWTVSQSGTLIAEGGPYQDGEDGSVVTVPLCLPEGCYALIIQDSWGDGMCCEYGEGGYELFNHNGVLITAGGEFTENELVNFCTDAVSIENLDLLGQAALTLYPTPASTSLRIAGLEGQATVTVLDAAGRLIDGPMQVGVGELVHTAAWAEGVVVLRVIEGDRVRVVRGVIQR
jgi:lysyl endopeptidase